MATPSAAVSSAVTGRAAEIRELDSMLGDLNGRGLLRVSYRTWDERRASADADGLRTIYLSMSGGDRRAAETETLNTIWESTVETYASQVLAAHARMADPADPEDMARAQLRGQFYSIAVKMALASNSPCSGNFRLGAYATHDSGFGTGVYPTSGTSGTPASGASPATPTPGTTPAAPAPTVSATAGASGSITFPTISGPGYTFLLQPGVPVLSMQELAVYTNRAMRALLEEDGSGQGSGTQAAEGIVARGRARAAASPPAQTAPATQVVKASLGGRFWAYDNEAVDVALNPVEGLLTAEQITALNGVKKRKLTGNYYFSEPVDTALAEAFYRAYEIGGQRTAERNPQRRGSGWVAASGATVATVGTVTAFKDGIFYAPVVAAKYAIPGAAGTWLPFVDLLWGVPIATASVVVGSAAYAKRKQIATYVNQHMVEPIRARYRAWGAPPAAAPAPTPAPVPAPPVAPLPGATAPVAPPIPAVVAIPVGAAAPPVVPAPVAPPAVPAPVAPPAAAPAPAPAPAPVAAPVAPVAPVVPLPAAAPPVAPAPSPLAAALAAAPPIVLPPAP